MLKILVTGGVRSGKSVVAERLLADLDRVRYVATGRPADPGLDPEWADRVAAHQLRRPQSWLTTESTDLRAVFAEADLPLLVDCLGTWLTATLDRLDAWHRDEAEWGAELDAAVADTVEALASCRQQVVIVTNEVGWGLVSEHRSGRIFADRLGWLNQGVARQCDEVHLVVAGRVLRL